MNLNEIRKKNHSTWCKRNPEKTKEYSKKNYQKNKVKQIAYAKAYQKKHREHVNAMERARYKKRGRIGKKIQVPYKSKGTPIGRPLGMIDKVPRNYTHKRYKVVQERLKREAGVDPSPIIIIEIVD